MKEIVDKTIFRNETMPGFNNEDIEIVVGRFLIGISVQLSQSSFNTEKEIKHLINHQLYGDIIRDLIVIRDHAMVTGNMILIDKIQSLIKKVSDT